MTFHFESNLDYQLQAIEAVCDLFKGQELCRAEFTVTKNMRGNGFFPNMENNLGIGNRLTLLDEELLKNLIDVQLRNGLEPSSTLASGDFTVEMETGTGKTYVYLRTILELNKRYGFTKFIIVVPSVAIKEGVYKSIEITQEHFKKLYGGIHYDYYLYDSSKLGQVRNFASNAHIQIMVMTVGAINKKDVNNLYKAGEKTSDEKPIDLIKRTRPILIVDEPQSVDGGLSGAGKTALEAMNPLCTLRYSATHTNKHQMVYRLSPIDAYERQLVKQIEVATATVKDAHNKPFIRLMSVYNKRGVITAKAELDIQTTNSVVRKEIIVKDGDDLEQTTRRAIYHNCRIGEISSEKGNEFLEIRVPSGEYRLRLGQAWGDVDALAIHREMIRRTIKEHLDKEKRLRPQGIKVLSLFFIDQVGRYRQYDIDGKVVKGVYAQIFEEEYLKWAKHPNYLILFQGIDPKTLKEQVHDGYFSIDKKGGWTDTEENNSGNRENAERAYNLIMKEKEKLLRFDTPLKFIFSHSALREGWDNPNIFQICSLRDIQTERERRQSIGRGLRLCVNQDLIRIRGFEVNTLTVIANESYELFAKKLQNEYEEDAGIRFGFIEPYEFASINISEFEGKTSMLGIDQSRILWEHFQAIGYIDAKGKVQDSLKIALKDGTLSVPELLISQISPIAEILRKRVKGVEIKNADERRPVRHRKEILHSPEFNALWDRIKYKSTYRLQFDNEKLIEKCIQSLQEAPPISKPLLQWRKANIAIGKAGVETIQIKGATTVVLDEGDIELPDILTDLQDRTQLTRRSIQRILSGSKRLNDFKQNPQQFIALASEVINRCKRRFLVDGIKYQRIGDDVYYAQELFENEELTGYLRNMIPSQKSVYEQVIYDSDTIECPFAEQLENNNAVKVYAKLPGWFKVPTPLGSYNPDWAILIEENGTDKIYFVVETKGSLFLDDLRDNEKAKITCGREHFKAIRVLDSPAQYIVVNSVDNLLNQEQPISQ